MRALRKVALALFALLLCGCPMTGKAPLGRVEDAFVDNALPGRWEAVQERDGRKFVLEIHQFNERELYLEARPSADNGADRGRAFVTAFGDARFMNYQDLKGYRPEGGWLYLKYAVGDNVLTFRTIEDDFVGRENRAKVPLADFVRSHKDNEAMLGDSIRFRKVESPAR